jgi:very-short-patch-repair endonuclease
MAKSRLGIGKIKSRLNKAKALRKNMIDAEQKLWFYLRGKRFQHVKFKRQKTIGPYIVDFVAVKHKLIMELDGGQHANQIRYDEQRTQYLERLGFSVLRFWNNVCLEQIEAVLEKIARNLCH